MILELRDLRVSYGHIQAVRGVSLGVREREIVALIGPNGAGKTSLLGAVAGLLRRAGGEALLDGELLPSGKAHAAVRRGIALVPEGRAILARMTVEENLILAAERHPGESIEPELKRFPSLERRRRVPAGSLSGGEQQMLAISRALLLRPRVLLLDEPSMGLAPVLVQQIFAAIRGIHQAGMTILLVEQNARMALSVAQRAVVLERGQIVLEGDPKELASDPRVQAAYLGGSVK